MLYYLFNRFPLPKALIGTLSPIVCYMVSLVYVVSINRGEVFLQFLVSVANNPSKNAQFAHRISPRSCAFVLALYSIVRHSRLEILCL